MAIQIDHPAEQGREEKLDEHVRNTDERGRHGRNS
jgi:hypothetical protein